MLENLVGVEQRYHELGQLLEEAVDDYQRAAELAKERSDIEPLVMKAQEYRQTLQRIQEARQIQNSNDDDLRELAAMELEELLPKVGQLEREIKTMLVPKDPRDERNVIVEIRAGPGVMKQASLPQICSACIPITLK
jgi:peptide chain release factor 1